MTPDLKERDHSDDIDRDGGPARHEHLPSKELKEAARDQIDAGEDSGMEIGVEVTAVEHGVGGGEEVAFVHGDDASIEERHLGEQGQECPDRGPAPSRDESVFLRLGLKSLSHSVQFYRLICRGATFLFQAS